MISRATGQSASYATQRYAIERGFLVDETIVGLKITLARMALGKRIAAAPVAREPAA